MGYHHVLASGLPPRSGERGYHTTFWRAGLLHHVLANVVTIHALASVATPCSGGRGYGCSTTQLPTSILTRLGMRLGGAGDGGGRCSCPAELLTLSGSPINARTDRKVAIRPRDVRTAMLVPCARIAGWSCLAHNGCRRRSARLALPSGFCPIGGGAARREVGDAEQVRLVGMHRSDRDALFQVSRVANRQRGIEIK